MLGRLLNVSNAGKGTRFRREMIDFIQWEERERMLVERARNARCSRQLRECFAEMKEWFSPIPRVVKKGKWEDEAEGQVQWDTVAEVRYRLVISIVPS